MIEEFVFSSGGGRQSAGALVLSAHKIFPYRTHIFCNVGKDSEDHETIDYVNNYLVPYAKDNNVDFKIVSKTGKTLLEAIYKTEYSIPIPAKFHYRNGKKNIGRRACTNDWKIRTSDYAIKNIFGNKNDPPLVHVGLGISLDEIHRVKTKPIQRMGSSTSIDDNNKNHYWNKKQEYPMIWCEEFTLFGKIFSENGKGLTANDCVEIVRLAGLPKAPKSACWFCPFHSISYWKELKKQNDPRYSEAVKLEKWLQQKEENMKRKHLEEGKAFNEFNVMLTDFNGKLEDLSIESNVEENELEFCDTGYCFI